MYNLKILAVDDDPIALRLLENGLKVADYEVKTAVNGLSAIDKINNEHFDVVITDLQMPGGVDGIDVLKTAKKKNSNTEVILITAYGSIDNAVKAMKKGAIDYLQKPINFDEVLLRLSKIGIMKKLLKDAGDLREAMDVTEKTASETIQDLEIRVAEKQMKLTEIKKILSNDSKKAQERINKTLNLI